MREYVRKGSPDPGLPSWLSTVSRGHLVKHPSHLEAFISSCRKGTVRLRALLALTFYKRAHMAEERTVGLGKTWLCLHETLEKTTLTYSGQKQIGVATME